MRLFLLCCLLPHAVSAQPIRALAPVLRAPLSPAAASPRAATLTPRTALPAALAPLARPALAAFPAAPAASAPRATALSGLAAGAAPLAAAMAAEDWRRAAELGSALFGEGQGRGDVEGTAPSAAPLNHYGRMFPNLPPRDASGFSVDALAKGGGPLDTFGNEGRLPDDGIPAGVSFLGQFIDHDITLEAFSRLESANDPGALRNMRTPFLDLDSVYGVGRHYFRARRDGFLLGPTDDDEYDLPRNREGTAIIPEHRNDENVVISQLHVAFLKLENKLRREHDAATAHRLAVWHYQWLVLHEYLPTIVGKEMAADVLVNGPRFYRPAYGAPYLPVEFTHAAYRFGHSTIRGRYRLNDAVEAPLFPAAPDAPPGADLRGGRPLPKEFVADWSRFFKMEEGRVPASWLKIGPWMVSPLLNLPDGVRPPDHPERSLAVRNLKRADALGVPSGQDVARAMGLTPIDDATMWTFFRKGGVEVAHDAPVPLWLYVTAESVLSGKPHLGPVGGRIVAEVFVGLLKSDPRSFLNAAPPGWTPTIPSAKPGEFGIADLLRFVR